MNLPNFLIVGSQKAGTTSLHDILSVHPEANMSTTKEINYFINQDKYSKGLDYYSSYFATKKAGYKVVGESSPGYLVYPGVAERIKNDLGKIKIVVILRDPIKRAYSQYWDNRRHLSEWYDENEIVDLFLNENYIPGERGYFNRGIYIKYIEKYISLFGENNICVMILENLIANQEAELFKLYSFLGLSKELGLSELPPASNSSIIWSNPIYQFFLNNPKYNYYIPKHLRRLVCFGSKIDFRYDIKKVKSLDKLKAFYKPWNEKLQHQLELDLRLWMN